MKKYRLHSSYRSNTMNLTTTLPRLTRQLCFIALMLTGTLASAQQVQLDSLRKKFNRYRITHASEKIYAHIDQELYLTGETLWFALYLVEGSLNTPSDLSKVAYLEILDRDNRPVLQTKVAMENGSGNGSLFLPASVESGNYTIRAYTNWMKNFSPEFYFYKPVTIINTFKKLDVDKSKTVAKPDAQFFPEGGDLVRGLKSKVAFRVVNPAGKGITFHGAVVDQHNDTVTTFKPAKFGMGSFDLTPLPDHEYRAVITEDNGQKNMFKLPAVRESGYVVRVTDSTENAVTLSVQSHLTTLPPIPVVYLLVHARNVISTASMHYLQKGDVRITVPKRDFNEGISHITLFDSEMHPVCERLYFTTPKKKLAVDIQSAQREYGIRRKVSLDITTNAVSNQPLASRVSVAVYKADSLRKDVDGNIFSSLWLSSDLAGTVEAPDYLMDEKNPDAALALDYVMLTHGWRRFTWSDVLTDTKYTPLFVPEFRGHVIKGKVTRPAGFNLNGAITYLATPGRNIQVYGSTSNSNGDVQYEMKDFSGPRKIILQTNFKKDSLTEIKILSPFSDKFAPKKTSSFTFSPTLEKQLIARSIGMQVQDVFYQDRSNQFRRPSIDTTAFYGKPDATYYLDDYTRFPVMEEVLREYVPGVLVRKRRDGFHFINLDVVNKGVFDEDPMVLLDGIPVFDIDQIMAFDPLKVKKLEVMTRRYYIGVLSLPGVVSFTTYAGDLGGFQLDPKAVVLDYEGLQLQRQFYSPKYETAKVRDSRLPDQRALLFWAPDVITGADGKQHVEFFTADQVGDYHVEVEGLTAGGFSGSGKTSFAVRSLDN